MQNDKPTVKKKNGNVDKKIPDIGDLVPTTVLNTKIKEVENKIPNVSGLVKKTDYNAKISVIEKKYFATSDHDKITLRFSNLIYFLFLLLRSKHE